MYIFTYLIIHYYYTGSSLSTILRRFCMGLLSTILTALSLSMDAFAVSITKGMTLKKIDYKIATKIAFSFGF